MHRNLQHNLTADCMCGIAGIYAQKERKLLEQFAKTMSDSMVHRGPDDAGIWSEEGMSLSHRRLSIIDLSSGGHQPMVSASKRYVITYNGEIYNFKSLKSELTDYPFVSASDTEVILAAFECWGVESFSRLRGQFALGIYDRLEKRLFIARDRMGEKPFYYYFSRDIFLFASEIRALLSTGLVEPKIHQRSVSDFLRYQSVIGPLTMIEGVFSLQPGHYGILADGNLDIKSYGSLREIQLPRQQMGRQELLQEVKELFSLAVREQMQSDVPMGAFLSGGIDSSAIVAMMSQYSDDRVHSFHVYFDHKDYDESQYAEMIAKKYNTRHTRIHLKPDVLLEKLPAILSAVDSPSGDGPNSYIISQAVRDEGIKVALSGLGGDDLFAGYPGFTQYKQVQKMRLFWKFPKFVRHSAADLAFRFIGGNKGVRLQNLLKLNGMDLPQFYSWNRSVFSEEDIRYVAPNLVNEGDTLVENMNNWLPEVEGLPVFGQYGLAELRAYTANVLLKDVDTMSMAHSLEVRCPFLDNRLVSLVLAVPDVMKYPHYPKQMLVDAISPALPESLVKRRKMGFSFPWDQWLRHELEAFVVSQIESLANRCWFDKNQLLLFYKRFRLGDPGVHWSKIWLLVVLESWYSSYGEKIPTFQNGR